MATVVTYKGKTPRIDPSAFLAETAVVIGDVEIGPEVSIWFGVIIRGDTAPIRIGARTNVQDGTIIHVDEDAPTTIGENVVIGHGAIVHGTTVGDGAQVSIGAILLSHSTVEPGAIVAASALVPEGATVPANTVVMGIPARPTREVTDQDLRGVRQVVDHYVEAGREYAQLSMPAEQ